MGCLAECERRYLGRVRLRRRSDCCRAEGKLVSTGHLTTMACGMGSGGHCRFGFLYGVGAATGVSAAAHEFRGVGRGFTIGTTVFAPLGLVAGASRMGALIFVLVHEGLPTLLVHVSTRRAERYASLLAACTHLSAPPSRGRGVIDCVEDECRKRSPIVSTTATSIRA